MPKNARTDAEPVTVSKGKGDPNAFEHLTASFQCLATLLCGISCNERNVQVVDDVGHTAFIDQDPMQGVCQPIEQEQCGT